MNWAQLKTILWLRWRLTRNQWTRTKGLGAAVAILVTIVLTTLAVTSFGGSFAAGVFLLRDAGPDVIGWIWLGLTLGFFMLWLISLVSELQRSETIDLQRLMHLPVALGQMFTFNYVVSHFTFSIFLFVPAMLGLSVGLAVTHGPPMLLAAPLALAMVFSVTAWTYCLRGWLAALMTNPRRRRAIIMTITAVFILIGQAPNLYFNVVRRFEPASGRQPGQRIARNGSGKGLSELKAAEKFIPPLWVAVGAENLANANALPAVLGSVGLGLLGAVGLRRAYRITLKFYYGETGGKAPSTGRIEKASGHEQGRPGLVGLRLRGVPEEAAAVATATFRSYLRAPEVKMAWASSFIVTLVFGASILLKRSSQVPEMAKPFVIVAPMAFSLLMMAQFLLNQFGFDRDGFRALVLSPADRKLILLGKNIVTLLVVGCAALFLMGLTAAWLRLSPAAVLAGLFQLASMILLGAFASNIFSILMPYRIEPGSLRRTKQPGVSVLLTAVCQMLFPVALSPVLAPTLAELLLRHLGVSPAIPINLIGSAALTSLLLVGYWKTLPVIGRLLQRRELSILSKVTQEIE